MIENKVLVSVNVPSLENNFDVYIPVNRKVYSVINMLKASLFELSQGAFNLNNNYVLYDAISGNSYDLNKLIRDTDIRNGSTIILL